MHSVDIYRKFRSPRVRVAAAVCTVIAFVATLWLSCSCGPECCDIVSPVQSAHMNATDHGCCDASEPEAPLAPKDCCSGTECCRADIATYKLAESPVHPVADYAGTLLDIPAIKAPTAIASRNHSALSIVATAHGPPPYLRFEILLI